MMTLAISADRRSYAYSYNEALSRLFFVEGLGNASTSEGSGMHR
ncbi:hypothetical protein [Corallococcus sp. AB049A]|nr:hypothetical protein [Corallococcus sp. AB049A]